MHRSSLQPNNKKGYILLMAILISSIILAISFGIYALTIKDVILASFLKDSSMALGAADRAMECALYWDRSTPQNGEPYTIFATSSQYTDITTSNGVDPLCDTAILNKLPSWTVTKTSSPDTGLTQFSLTYPDNTCADVSVLKEGVSTTTIVSNGYNICGAANLNNPRRTQRTIQVQGNF